MSLSEKIKRLKEAPAATIKASLRARTWGIKKTRWIRFTLVAILWVLFTIWMERPWLLLVLPLLFDIYITGYIPFTWWKRSKDKTVRTVMAWVDAIVYALILVYFIFNFVGQNYQIPSSSLEKTLLTGDYLFVSKVTYGPRVPMTPIHFPLVHNTLPILNCNSYLEWPNVKYHRLKGLRDVERYDIVVFNFPAGDTVMTHMPNPDYYQLVNLYGYHKVNTDKATFGKKITRPVDRRENYVKRAVGLPGERLKIVEGVIYIDGKPLEQPKNVQFNYIIQTKPGQTISDNFWENIGVSPDDIAQMHNVSRMFSSPSGMFYYVPLTNAMLADVRSNMAVAEIIPVYALPYDNDLEPLKLYPYDLSTEQKWTRANYGGEEGIYIPRKGDTVELDREAWSIYERPIRVYENNPSAYWDEEIGKVVINGKPVDSYTFEMDYYFMMGDNRDNSLDSRYWGFVPEDHIVGTPLFVIASFDKDKSIFGGKIRWNRFFRDANPDK